MFKSSNGISACNFLCKYMSQMSEYMFGAHERLTAFGARTILVISQQYGLGKMV
jgi:hypothetical protein